MIDVIIIIILAITCVVEYFVFMFVISKYIDFIKAQTDTNKELLNLLDRQGELLREMAGQEGSISVSLYNIEQAIRRAIERQN